MFGNKYGFSNLNTSEYFNIFFTWHIVILLRVRNHFGLCDCINLCVNIVVKCSRKLFLSVLHLFFVCPTFSPLFNIVVINNDKTNMFFNNIYILVTFFRSTASFYLNRVWFHSLLCNPKQMSQFVKQSGVANVILTAIGFYLDIER